MTGLNARAARAGEEGAFALPAVALVLCLLVSMGLFVDIAMLSVAYQREQNQVQVVADVLSGTNVSMRIKNSDHPGKDVALYAMRTLRANGYDGEIEVWYWEDEREDLPSTARACAWGVQIEKSVPTLFLRFSGVGEAVSTASNSDFWVSWSSGRVWRPVEAGCGKYWLGAGADVSTGNSEADGALISYEAVSSYSELPAIVSRAYERAVGIARTEGGSE